MPQVLKEEVRDGLVAAASEVFFAKGFARARLADIASRAGVSTGLAYSYFKNKEALFQTVISPLPLDFEAIAHEEEAIEKGSPFDKYQEVAAGYIETILRHHREFVILIDKSQGTAYEGAKESLIASVQSHIEREFIKNKKGPYPALLPHILASNFVAGLLEIARHYESPEQARELLGLVIGCYYKGVNSL
ncbi:Toluene efflux pump ttgABC operon repressor [Mobiluncus holmesii]|nr:Toluene efflux pump ttgABC operon repressor [Mobiluncus holmesii]